MIEVTDLQKTYPGKVQTKALRGVSFSIKPGEFVAIMGRSGSGKSTLMHQLGLLDTPTAGSIQLDGVDVMALTDQQKTAFRLQKLGYVFQEYALIAEMTAVENVTLPALALYGGDSRRWLSRGTELLGLVGLSDRLGHYPHELSGGEQQRVAIARALINDPKIVFADEPTANLDSASSEGILKLFKELNRKLGQTIVMVTHEPEDRRFVDRVIVLKDGQIVQ